MIVKIWFFLFLLVLNVAIFISASGWKRENSNPNCDFIKNSSNRVGILRKMVVETMLVFLILIQYILAKTCYSYQNITYRITIRAVLHDLNWRHLISWVS